MRYEGCVLGRRTYNGSWESTVVSIYNLAVSVENAHVEFEQSNFV